MKKNSIRALVVLAVLLVVYHVAIFALPFPKAPVFFLSWVFTLVAMLAQGYVMWTAFGQGNDARSRFYGFPIAKVGIVYLAAQLVLGIVFMALGTVVPLWLPLLLYVVLLGAAVVGFIGTDATRDEIIRQDAKLQKDVSTMRALQSKAASLPLLTTDAPLKKELSCLAEQLRYSDPVSSEATQDAENRLAACINDIEAALVRRDTTSAISLAETARLLLGERDRLCKASKAGV